jgi:general L-amino acid transport system substrate-binding protein
MRKPLSWLLVLVLMVSSAALAQGMLETIRSRGSLVCGVNDRLPGWGTVTPEGRFVGFDVDFCRALAAAVLGDAEAVTFRPLTAVERFTAVQTGEVDVLIRNSTWTSTRDTTVGLHFGPVNYYDGQGFMVRADSGITALEDFEGRRICVQTGTTTELNLADVMHARDIEYTPVIFEVVDVLTAAYDDGACDGWTTDVSGLVSRQITLRNPDEHIIMDEVISKEPLAPAVLQGDDEWFNAVKWLFFGLMEAEEYGITSQNVDELAETSEDPTILRILGVEGEALAGTGLLIDGIRIAVQQVGNYGEIYDRNLGTPFNLPRGLNALWTEGGLIYGMPIR